MKKPFASDSIKRHGMVTLKKISYTFPGTVRHPGRFLAPRRQKKILGEDQRKEGRQKLSQGAKI